ncbi:MAG: hypothetical protein ABI612_13450 [Betaproteobacteria bacterium]
MAQRNGFGSLPVTGLVAVLLAIAGAILWKAAPFDVNRPAVTAPLASGKVGLQDVDARLWEDPFAAIARVADSDEEPDATRTIVHVCDQLRERVRANAKLLVVGVMVSKAPYADGEEQRRRVRYAVASGLNVAQFVPENGEHLGYVRWGGDTVIPFELFRRNNRSVIGFDLVSMVLWLEDEAFSSVHAPGSRMPGVAPTPVFRLNQLAQEIKTNCGSVGAPLDAEHFQFQVIGPAQSSTVKAMIEEMEQEPNANTVVDETYPRLNGVDFYSPFATASETELLQRRREDEPPPGRNEGISPCQLQPREPACSLQRFFAEKGVRFAPATASDDRLALALVEELETRGVSVRSGDGSNNHVALISEWDTYSGRMLQSAFTRAAGLERVCETDLSAPQPHNGERGQPCRILRFSYLRGLDGVAPAGTPQSSTEQSKTGARTAQVLERADGPKQIDYLRRLAARIGVENDRLRRAGEGEIGAIGVLGSDVYDKITILRALRASVPRAVFFTTDLDARLLNPQEYHWTRNLLVSASFGLELAPCLQQHIPPFRGSYETATYYATRVALHSAFPGSNTYRDERCPNPVAHTASASNESRETASSIISPERLTEWLRTPRVFEIGRTRAIDLRESEGQCGRLATCADIHAPGRDLHNVMSLIIGLAVLVAILGLLCVSRVTRPIVLDPLMLAINAGRGHDVNANWIAVLAPALLFAGLILFVILLMFISVTDPRGEPFIWSEGVSIWPSELIRLLALILGVCFLVYLFRAIQRSDDALEQQFHLPRVDDKREPWQRISGELDPRDAATGVPRIALLWSQYLRSGSWTVIMMRSLVWAFIFVVVAGLLFLTLGAPNHPIRGLIAERVDVILILAVGAVFVLLLFSVSATIRLCANFIDELMMQIGTRDWPEETRREFAQKIGVRPETDAAIAGEVLDPWIDVHFIARRTEAIGTLAYFPFVLLALMIVARWSIFDNWDVPVALVVVFGFGFILACVNAFLMQRAAARARRLCLERLHTLLLKSKGHATDAYPHAAHLEAMIEAIGAIRTGAFALFTEQPLVRAVLIPFGSVGGLYLVDLFALASS